MVTNSDRAPSIFISYARVDEHVVHKLASDLESRGVAVWYDARLHPGDDWRLEILTRNLTSRLKGGADTICW
jgi:hypothetical protein